jgi:hypothetical protein
MRVLDEGSAETVTVGHIREGREQMILARETHLDALLREFQVFWRMNSEAWEGMLNYPEAFPHLLLQAFLQRATNGGIEREYAAGRGRMDLAVECRGGWDIIEVKLLRAGKDLERIAEEGKRQVLRYRESFSPARAGGKGVSCYLVIFDRRPEKGSWDERLFWRTEGEVTVLGC